MNKTLKRALRGAAKMKKPLLKAGRRAAKMKKPLLKAGRRAAKATKVALKDARVKVKKAERSGAIEKWSKRAKLGVDAVQFAMLATAAVKGARLGKARPARRKAKTA